MYLRIWMLLKPPLVLKAHVMMQKQIYYSVVGAHCTRKEKIYPRENQSMENISRIESNQLNGEQITQEWLWMVGFLCNIQVILYCYTHTLLASIFFLLHSNHFECIWSTNAIAAIAQHGWNVIFPIKSVYSISIRVCIMKFSSTN